MWKDVETIIWRYRIQKYPLFKEVFFFFKSARMYNNCDVTPPYFCLALFTTVFSTVNNFVIFLSV